MTHGKIIKPGARSTYQCHTGIDKEGKISREGSSGTSTQIRYFSSPSLSLSARGRSGWKAGSNPGHQDCLYGKAIQKSDQGTSKICKDQRRKLERDSNPSSSSLSAKRSEAWLRQGNALERLSWNTALTDCQWKRSCKLIGYWSLKKYGNRVM